MKKLFSALIVIAALTSSASALAADCGATQSGSAQQPKGVKEAPVAAGEAKKAPAAVVPNAPAPQGPAQPAPAAPVAPSSESAPVTR